MAFTSITNSEIATGAIIDTALLGKVKNNFDDHETRVNTLESTPAVPADLPSVEITALNIDWSLGKAFYKAITADSTFTFSNLVDGKTITVVLTNATGSAYTIAFPTTKQETASLDVTLYANSSSIYTFFRCNGITYCYSVSSIV